ncbi:hypothetical protein ACCQ08_08620 [Comamonas sp. SY3]|uniref:hypothetical protein n=1 Tax=Comamonas sp. SY3 TaxID=3243601 RepID=UPI0035948F80
MALITIANVAEKQETGATPAKQVKLGIVLSAQAATAAGGFGGHWTSARGAALPALHRCAHRCCAWRASVRFLQRARRGLPNTTIAPQLQPVDVLGGHRHNRFNMAWRRTNATQISLQILTSAAKVASADVRQ